MQSRWIKRRAHTRRLRNGGTAFVRESWSLLATKGADSKSSYRHPCPQCGAKIISVHMPNGGWAHFEGAKGLGRVKHPCLHLGEGLLNAKDDKTRDLFDERAG